LNSKNQNIKPNLHFTYLITTSSKNMNNVYHYQTELKTKLKIQVIYILPSAERAVFPLLPNYCQQGQRHLIIKSCIISVQCEIIVLQLHQGNK